jgi:hypothetical protein
MKASSVTGILLAAALQSPALAESALPKEGNGNTTAYYTGSGKRLDAGKDYAVLTYDVLGVSMNDAGQGFMHGTSVRCMGSIPAMKGAYDNEHGICIVLDKDGDQVFIQYTAAGRLGASGKVNGTYVGGTGKYAGISGSSESTRTPLRPVEAGMIHSVSKTTYKYKLP